MHFSNLSPDRQKAFLSIVKETAAAAEVVPIREGLDTIGAPVPPQVAAPRGYVVKTSGVYTEEKGTMIFPTPVVITEIYEDVKNRAVGLEIAWMDQGSKEWRRLKRKRSMFAIPSKIVELSDAGFPVDGNNAKQAIRYISAFEAQNASCLPRRYVSRQMGWLEQGFMLGRTLIGGDGVQFQAENDGEEQLADAIMTKGTLDGWLNVLETVKAYPRVIAGVYASLASVLLEPLQAEECFWFEWSGETSKGKTTSLLIAASVWGKPHKLKKSWHLTPVAVERLASVMNHLPIFLDDTKNAKRKNDIPSIVYNHTEGVGKVRGSIAGMQETATWKCIAFSTGESKITQFRDQNGEYGAGIAARVLSVDGLPFERADKETAEIVREIESLITEHYGVMGQAFIRYLMEHIDDLPTWREHYESTIRYYRENAENSVSGRLAKHMAFLDTAAHILHDEILRDQYAYRDALEVIWQEIIADNADIDRPKKALEHVYSFALANKGQFLQSTSEEPMRDTLGEWNTENAFWAEIRFFPHALKKILRDHGDEPEAILKSWRQRGWIDAKRGYTKQIRINGARADVIAIRRQAIDTLLGENE